MIKLNKIVLMIFLLFASQIHNMAYSDNDIDEINKETIRLKADTARKISQSKVAFENLDKSLVEMAQASKRLDKTIKELNEETELQNAISLCKWIEKSDMKGTACDIYTNDKLVIFSYKELTSIQHAKESCESFIDILESRKATFIGSWKLGVYKEAKVDEKIKWTCSLPTKSSLYDRSFK